MTEDRVRLIVPARGEYAKTVRMTASALVSRMGMTYDEVDDVRMAADEAFVYAVDSMGDDAEVAFEFVMGDSTFLMEVRLGHGTGDSDEDEERRAGLATFILDSVCDRYEFVSDESGSRTLRVVKHVGTANAD